MKKNVIITLLVAFSLAVALFTVILVGGQSVEYDPWIDINDDGKIDMKDIGRVARAFGATGTAINKTALLLELQDGLAELNATVDSLAQRVAALEGQGAMVICAEISHYTTQMWTPPPPSLNPNDIKIDFPVTFTNPSNVELSVSGTVTTGTCAGYPFRVTDQQIEMTYAVLSLQGWNGASWVDLGASDEVDVSYVAIEPASNGHDCIVVTGDIPYDANGPYHVLNGLTKDVSSSIPSGYTLVSVFATGYKTNEMTGARQDEPPLILEPKVSGNSIQTRVWDASGNEYGDVGWSGMKAHIDYTLFITK